MTRKLTMCVLAVAGLTAGCGPLLVVSGGATVGRAVVQERSTLDALNDTTIQISLNNAFLNHSGELFRDVSTDVTEGRVLLTGSVPRRDDKVAATRIAWETDGVVEVTDELTVEEDAGTIAYFEDVAISNRLRAKLLGDADVRSLNYNVETVGKVVHITGLARSRSELSEVLTHAQSVPGVARVVSHVLTIDDPRRQLTSAPQQPAG